MMGVSSVVESKRAMRRQILRARRRLDHSALAANAVAVSAVLRERLGDVQVVAAYVPFGSEPGSLALLDELRVRGVRVLLPVQGPDWARYDGALIERHWSEPEGPRLGARALEQAELVIVPALAVDRNGNRLGRGGGFYDRVLAGVRAPVVALLHDGELVDAVPAEEHDRRVDAVVLPTMGWFPITGVDGKGPDRAP